MDVSEFAGSDFMKAADLGNTTPQLQVAKVEPVDFQDGSRKLLVHWSDPDFKPTVLNVTNTRACIAAWGKDSTQWLNKSAMLSVRQTQMGPGIGVTPLAVPAGQTTSEAPFNDGIPY